ncbi:Dynamitin-domain-containing protein [Vararia minispora EC-137]|uniref:Dynamitin-domain-containing protein n=1 Tax=Vararia minispora EC-137 TaxID=1314806 RepID=A0ACB8QVP1_9AGAM|nr:Dynamitin-domain-containing protein [Vararia minispora EC-137]
MSKYANLPDIDTAPDIYETEDVVLPSANTDNGEYSDDDSALPTRSAVRGKPNDATGREEVDNSHLIGADEASKLFKRAERRRRHDRAVYSFPASRSSSPSSKPRSLTLRLHQLQVELSSLETELADPTNLYDDRDEGQVDSSELIKGLVEVKSRLEKLNAMREGRSRLRNILKDVESTDAPLLAPEKQSAPEVASEQPSKPSSDAIGSAREVAEIDRRLVELEKVVGSSSAALDETSPMPLPLLPLLTRLSTQLTVLTQPRHLDNISRRLKLLLTDLDRLSSGKDQHRRQQSHHPDGGGGSIPTPSAIHDQLSPILTRLVPMLPQIPHILTRLRTLSALHTSATEFQRTTEGLEEDQRRLHETLEDLDRAVTSIETSLKENSDVVKKNVAGLEERIQSLTERLENL